jgi:hypothetical protein
VVHNKKGDPVRVAFFIAKTNAPKSLQVVLFEQLAQVITRQPSGA